MSEELRGAVLTFLEKLCKDNDGTITPDEVVKAGRAKSSPIHSCFDWDNASAGDKYRLTQARQLLRMRATFVVEDTSVVAPVFVRDATAESGEQGYVRLTDIRNRKGVARETLLREMARVTAAVERGHAAATVLDMAPIFERMLQSINRYNKKIQEELAV